MSDGKILKRNIAEISEEWVKLCGANRNLARNVINISDGLKPVQRRTLFYLYNTVPNESTSLIKVAKIQGCVIGEYHPHGDSSVYDAIVRMVQWWKNNIPLLGKQGTFGNQRGDDAGQARYIHAGLTEFAWKCFLSEMKYVNVDMMETYVGDGTMEPEYLPSRYPYMFLNGSIGVGEGLASNIPPYNFKEVLEVTKQLIDNPDKSIYLVPDSPTGCYIVDDGQFNDVCNDINIDSTRSKYRQKAIIEVDDINNIINITNIPLNTSTDDVTKLIVDNRNQWPEVKDIKDSTGEYIVDLKIELKDDVNPQKFIEKLYKKTSLEKGYAINLVMIDNYEPKDFTIKSALLKWIENRRDTVTSYYTNKLVKYMSELRMYEILVFMTDGDNSNESLNIIKNNKKDTAKKLLMQKFNIDSVQAGRIANMRLYQLSLEMHDEYVEKYNEYKKLVEEMKTILSDDKYLDKHIKEELDEGIKLFGSDRKSPIISEEKEKKIPNKDVLLAISRDGFAKKVKMKTPAIGKVGNKNSDYTAIVINERDNLLVFDKAGRVSKIPTHSIPMVDVSEVGISLKRYFTVADDIICMMKDISDKNIKENAYIIFITEHGFSKKTKLDEFNKIKDYKLGINLEEGDKLASVIITSENDTRELITYTNLGRGMKLNPKESVRTYSRNSKGLCLTNLQEGEHFVSADIIDSDNEYLAYITSTGCMKLTETKYLPTVDRKSDMLRLINLDEKEQLVGIISVNKNSTITIYKKSGDPQEIEVKSMEVTTRASKATKIIKLRRGDSVVAYKVK